MATTTKAPDTVGADRILESVQDAENAALEAVRKFLDTVNGVFPDLNGDGAPRKKIIDSAFRMTEQLIGASNQLAQKVIKVGQGTLGESSKGA